ncbi:MAG: hypothetical protein KAT65_22260 [Methanophagales archaeon]|nr:hypothetical protein [Methanophagales archaeon]
MSRRVFGTIRWQETYQPAVGVKVRAWDWDFVGGDKKMEEDITDNNGNYVMEYDDGHWDPAPHCSGLWRPDIYLTVAVYKNGHWHRVFESTIHWDHRLRHDLRIDACIDPPPDPPITSEGTPLTGTSYTLNNKNPSDVRLYVDDQYRGLIWKCGSIFLFVPGGATFNIKIKSAVPYSRDLILFETNLSGNADDQDSDEITFGSGCGVGKSFIVQQAIYKAYFDEMEKKAKLPPVFAKKFSEKIKKIQSEGEMDSKLVIANCAEGLGLFDQECKDKEGKGYPIITDQACKAIDMCGIQAHAGYYMIGSGGKEFEFDIDKYPLLYLTMKAEEGTDTCLLLMVHEKEPRDFMRRFVAIGKTREGERSCVSVGLDGKDCFPIKDDNKWHDYIYDLRKLREDYPDAKTVRMVQFYSGKLCNGIPHAFHFSSLAFKK